MCTTAFLHLSVFQAPPFTQMMPMSFPRHPSGAAKTQEVLFIFSLNTSVPFSWQHPKCLIIAFLYLWSSLLTCNLNHKRIISVSLSMVTKRSTVQPHSEQLLSQLLVKFTNEPQSAFNVFCLLETHKNSVPTTDVDHCLPHPHPFSRGLFTPCHTNYSAMII